MKLKDILKDITGTLHVPEAHYPINPALRQKRGARPQGAIQWFWRSVGLGEGTPHLRAGGTLLYTLFFYRSRRCWGVRWGLRMRRATS